MFRSPISRPCLVAAAALASGSANAQFLLTTADAQMSIDGAASLAICGSTRHLSAGDIDNDGMNEDIEGVPMGSPASVFAMGMVFITRDPTALGDPLLVFTPLAHQEFSFGESVCAGGDVDGDGFADIAVGAPADGAGSVHIYSGQTGLLIAVVGGEGLGDRFGHDVSIAGDIDGDGLADLIVSAPWNDGGAADAGRVYVFASSDWSLYGAIGGTHANAKLGLVVDAWQALGEADAPWTIKAIGVNPAGEPRTYLFYDELDTAAENVDIQPCNEALSNPCMIDWCIAFRAANTAYANSMSQISRARARADQRYEDASKDAAAAYFQCRANARHDLDGCLGYTIGGAGLGLLLPGWGAIVGILFIVECYTDYDNELQQCGQTSTQSLVSARNTWLADHTALDAEAAAARQVQQTAIQNADAALAACNRTRLPIVEP